MGRIVIIIGPPELGAVPALREWAYQILHRLLAYEPWRTQVYGRLATPPEQWAHEIGRTCGHHVTDFRLDGVRWSTRHEATDWSRGEANLWEASRQLALAIDWHLREGWIVEARQLVIDGVEHFDPLVPMLGAIGVKVIREVAPWPGWGGRGGLVPCMP